MTIPHLSELAIIPLVAIGALVAMTFTPTDITALLIASATLLGAFLSGVALIITAIRSTRKSVAAKLDENTELTQAVQAKVGEVAVKVDGTASRAQEQIASLQTELKWMRERLGEQRQDAALLAQAKAAPPISATNIQNGSDEHLGKISENTEEIKRNTAKP